MFGDAMPTLDEITANLPRFREVAESMREIMLANLTMIGEIPAPTFGENERIQFIAGRFAEAGLQNCSIDSKGNAYGVLPGSEGKQNILLLAHADTIVENAKDQVIEIKIDHVVGPFVGDNSIALAALTTLPWLFEKLELRLKSNLVFAAAARTQGRGNLEGVKHFLSTCGMPFTAGLCVEGVQLGRLNYSCMGVMRGEITCRLPDDYKWEHYGSSGTIVPMSDIVNRISRIPTPTRPFASIIIGSIEGGISHNNIARETKLRLEVRSESAEILQQIHQQIKDLTEDVAGQTGIKITLDIFGQREPGGIDISHPLVRNARAILTALNIQPVMYATTSLHAALRDAAIPALTLAVTTGERRSELDEIDESVPIAPMFTGLAQLVGIVASIDGGLGA